MADKDFNIVCTGTNLAVNTELSLWTPLLTEEARRQACTQYRGRCCNCGCTDHSLRWCPSPFKNVFSLLNPEFTTQDPDGSTFETWIRRMRTRRRKGPQRRYQGNGMHHMSDTGPPRPRSSGHFSAPKGNSAGTTPAPSVAAPPDPLPAPATSAPAPAASAMRYGPTYSANSNPNARQPGTFRVQSAVDP